MGRALTIGDLVGSYRLIGKLGEGGMGLVFVAEHATIGKRAAVKVLLPQFSQNPEFVRRFFNEARAVTQIRHPGLIDVYDFGQHEQTGCAYIVMELLEGESLATRLTRERQLSEPLLVEVAQQMAGVLATVHTKNIIHRDLKPDNVFLVPDPSTAMRLRVKVLDFGIAKLTDSGATSAKTRTGALLGTPAYMAPEQCRGLSNLDHRADVYSLGCMMYEMAAATQPFVGEGMGDVLAAHIYEEPKPVQEIAPQISAQLASIIARAMAKKPDHRYSSMDDLEADLAAIRLGVGQLAGTVAANSSIVVSASVTRSRTTLSSAASELTATRERDRGRRLPILAVVGALATAGAIAFTVVAIRRDRAIAPLQAGQPQPPKPEPRDVRPMTKPEMAPLASANVSIAINSVPSGAEILRRSDGARLGVTPWSTEITRSAGHVAYTLRAPGFHHEEVDVDTSEDRQLTVRMKPSKRAASPDPSASSRVRRHDDKQPEFNAP
jgi:serine/threonine-protein kinase